ncbi:LysR family transcriptional regulator [Marinomonas mediterranea]|uniref:Transcriptional regulator, LysR family n=1 Tax=Marinomonas mediterranea (strain ATCC 700492 / JCM 21426 / NBRC 103028 / MMB-1) TaxID=717774 RepID=F2K4N7_MARM1|nr:LysR family transcriptional regulator [Marinomonas mediterranea]ADZ91430.1 transcriptional regulator, LysR family [Marinomonas mediterranea MMB-1]WCN09397.1 LysR family transcriptional regulator [Marinomonas mediterranea]WCN13474.1 LysR family transcriptional regulator [Marinomonas mediterranea]WCN17540.1 LysR family transcriptional regulator [Marinomonas mediterranea MMB-1]
MATIDQLKILIAIAESRSLSHAAEKVSKTQPALTTAIKQLESVLNVSLFNREGYRLSLTNQGNILYQKAKKVIELHQEFIQTAHNYASGKEERISLAIEASFELETIFSKLEPLQQRHKSTQIVIKQEYLSGPVEQIHKGEVDLAITPIQAEFKKNGELEFLHVSKGALINVAASKLVNKFESLTSVKQLIDTYQVVVQDSGSMTTGVNVGVQSAQRYWYVNNFATKLSLIQSGMGWGRLPEHFVKDLLKSGELLEIELNDYASRIEFDYKLIKRNDKLLGPVATELWNSFKKT